MASRKRDADFRELVGEVKPLTGTTKRVALAAPKRTALRTRTHASPELTVEVLDEVVLGYASDASIHAAHELAHGPVPPVRQLDLHRMSVVQARHALARALRLARTDGMRSLVVLCGRGKHSGPGGPVLPSVVLEELRGAESRHVLALRTAPPQFGGAGVLIVRLRGDKGS